MKSNSHGLAVLYVGKPCSALNRLLNGSAHLAVDSIDVVPTLAEAEGVLQAKRPSVMVISVAPPGLDEHRRVYEMRAKAELPPLVLLSPRPPADLTLLALSIGARECVREDVSTYNFADVLRECSHNGHVGCRLASSHKLCRSVTDALRSLPPSDSPGPRSCISRREKEVLELASRGLANKEIAATLYIQEQTVKNHMGSILRKLRVKGRAQAAALALRNGWICPPRTQA